MIIKLDISGEAYQSLMEMLQSDANFYQEEVLCRPSYAKKTPIITVKASKSDGTCRQFDALPDYCITLEVKKFIMIEGRGSRYTRTPLSLLEKLFDAVDLFSSDEDVAGKKEQESS